MTINLPFPHGNRLRVPVPALATIVRIWTWTELALLMLLAQKALWTEHANVITLGLAWVLFTSILDLKLKLYNKKTLGLVWGCSRRTGWIVEQTLLLVALIWLAGLITGSARNIPFDSFLARRLGYLSGALAQQFLTESYVFVRLERLLGGKKATSITALILSWAHRPNRWLILITLVGGYISSAVFRRYRNLYALALAHGMIGAALPAFWHLRMRVGLSYLKLFNKT